MFDNIANLDNVSKILVILSGIGITSYIAISRSYRERLSRFNYVFYIPVIIIISFIGVIRVYMTDGDTLFNIGWEYSFILTSKLFNSKNPVFYYFFISNLINYTILFYVIDLIKRRLFKKRYIKCPHCSMSVKVCTIWSCNYCYNMQKKERYITDKCDHCKRELESVFCEHCHEEITL